MSKTSSRHPVRTLVLIAALVAIVLAFRNAISDKGGSYEPSISSGDA